jgi:hypothetical protein
LNKDIIHNAIEHPEVALNAGVEDLEKISSQYPYFGAAQLLLTKAYQRTNNYRYTDQLHQAAIYSTDRKHLYDWVKKPLPHEVALATATAVPATRVPTVEPVAEVNAIPEPEVTQTPEVAEVQEVVPILSPKVSALVSLMLEDELPSNKVAPLQATAPETDKKPLETITSIEPATPVAQETGLTLVNEIEETAEISHQESIESVSTETDIEHEVVEESSVAPTEAPSPSISLQQMDPIEAEILLEAMHSSIELEVGEEVEAIANAAENQVSEKNKIVESQESTSVAEVPQEEDEDDSYASWIFKRSQQVHFSDADKPALRQEEPQAVSDWVRAPRPEQVVDVDAEEENVTEELTPSTNVEEPHEVPVEEKTYPSHGIQKLTPSTTKSHQQDLIDRFIKFEPKITPGKALEYTAGNFAKESLEEDFSFVTETMAILFAQQGKPDKARKAFKKLMELHPEKSVYFAAQLKNLDKYKK